MWTSDGTTFYEGDCQPGDREATVPELAAIAFGKAKRETASAIAAAYAMAIARGCAHRGKVIQIDPESRANIDSMTLLARLVTNQTAGAVWPEDLALKGWRTLDNTHLPVTPEQMVEMSLVVAAHFVAIRFRASALKDALIAASTIQAVELIDPTTGWPGE